MSDFGDPSLFSEFEKPREPSDRILREKVLSGEKPALSRTKSSTENGTESKPEPSQAEVEMRDSEATSQKASSSVDNSSDSGDSDGENNESDNDSKSNKCTESERKHPNIACSSNVNGTSMGDNIRNTELLKQIEKLTQESILYLDKIFFYLHRF